MGMAEDILALQADVETLKAEATASRREEQGFREFAVAGIMEDIRRIKLAVGLPPELDNLDKPDPLEPVVEDPADAIAFTGVAYVSGRRISGLSGNSSLPWVKVDVSDSTASEEAGPPGSPFPPNEEWFEKSKTSGDIHVTRL